MKAKRVNHSLELEQAKVAVQIKELEAANFTVKASENAAIGAMATAKSALESATEASQAKSRFLANMSHELRTPLMHLDTRLVRALKTTTDDTVRSGIAAANDAINI